jgi:signal transduction histidine kinase/DNA-binding response OmpR family regulator/CHASE3 domain sensor protein
MFKFSFRQQVFTGFIVSLGLVFAVFYFSYTSIGKLKEDQNLVAHTEDVIETANKVQALLLDGETGQRGYVATAKENFLEPYNKSVFQVPNVIQKLASLTGDNPAQQNNIDSLNKYASLKRAELAAIIEDAKASGFESARIRMQDGRGKYYMDQVRAFVQKIVKEENRLLVIRKASTESAAGQAILAIFAGGLIVVCVVLVLFFYIQKTFAQQKKAEEEIRVTNIELEKVLAENEAKNWLLTGTGILNEKMQGQQSEKELAHSILSEVCKYTNAVTGTLYLFNEQEEVLELYAYYAFHDLGVIKKTVKLSEGWLGQVAKDKKAAIIKGTLNDKLELETSIISQELVEIMIVPFFFDNKLKGVIEMAYQDKLSDNVNDYVLATANDIGIAINTAQARTIMHDLFEETQQQAEELEAQQEEMRVTNEELVNKTEMLQASEEELRVQQEELRTINAELEEKASLLEEKNQAIEEARASINIKVQELETTGRYKSEFLANMSHELRTPLNSILVLARILKDNKGDNLSEDQIKYASVIFNAGNDLLTLINDILDLSKIESGKLEMMNEQVKVQSIIGDMEMLFAEMAASKKIKFTSAINDVPETIYTDRMRVEQVIKNLLSNAFKFTPEGGSIAINVNQGDKPKTINFTIKDTGIGISPEKQKLIFEAFQQADGSTSRKYGGTGLGLSISRELANLLGGKISVKSEQGQGSEFTLTIPYEAEVNLNQEENIQTAETFTPAKEFLKPASQLVRKGPDEQPLVVIVEDDKNFADILKDYARDHGYRALVIHEGTFAFETIKENQPDAVILDIMLPGKDGWAILKELKKSAETSSIPVHLMSAGEAAANRVRREGAISFMKKPIDTGTLDKLFGEMTKQSGVEFKQILLVEDHHAQSEALKEMMEKQGITVDQAFDGASAFDKLQDNEYQCVILDLNLPDISGLDLLDKIKGVERFASLPVIVNTAMELDKASVNRLMQYANAMVIKTSKSSDRLIDEVNLFLHKISSTPQAAANPAGKLSPVSQGKEKLKGKKVLVVDDDMRNIFALTSALQSYDFVVEIANDGEEAIAKLEQHGDIDIVLMDIMMPKMDGYEATRYIRKQNKWAKLPVIALTAKAMRDDREKCIAAGASDYITKPVDIDRLISLMQLWLEK